MIGLKKSVWLAAVALTGCFSPVRDVSPDATSVSPDGKNEIRLWTDPLAYEVLREGVVVVSKTGIGLTVDGKRLVQSAKCLVRQERKSGFVGMPIYKRANLDLSGMETIVDFGDWGVRLAARNDGVAYRFETKRPGTIVVNGEQASVTIPDAQARCSLNYGSDYGCEETVPLSCQADEIRTSRDRKRKFVYLPFVYEVGGKHVAVTESDVCDYPVWNLSRGEGTDGVSLDADFARWPKTVAQDGGAAKGKPVGSSVRGRWVRVRETSDCLVMTEGTRTFPWRTFLLADDPSRFCEADIVMVLAREKTAGDFSWVRPGKVAWDWWNAWDNQGRTNGCTTATYKRFIDFAAKAGVEYVILDEGWSEKLNIWKFHPSVDVPEIIRYGKEKGVGIILWMAWAQVVGELNGDRPIWYRPIWY